MDIYNPSRRTRDVPSTARMAPTIIYNSLTMTPYEIGIEIKTLEQEIAEIDRQKNKEGIGQDELRMEKNNRINELNTLRATLTSE